jgi:hypothetical protein
MHGAGGGSNPRSNSSPDVCPPCFCSLQPLWRTATPVPSAATQSAASESAAAAEAARLQRRVPGAALEAGGTQEAVRPAGSAPHRGVMAAGDRQTTDAFAHFNVNPIVGLISLCCFACVQRALQQSVALYSMQGPHAGPPVGLGVCSREHSEGGGSSTKVSRGERRVWLGGECKRGQA